MEVKLDEMGVAVVELTTALQTTPLPTDVFVRMMMKRMGGI